MRTRKRKFIVDSDTSNDKKSRKKNKPTPPDNEEESEWVTSEEESETEKVEKKCKNTIKKEVSSLDPKLKEKYDLLMSSSKKKYTIKDILESDADDESMQIALKLYNRKIEITKNKDIDFEEGEPTTPEGFDSLICEILRPSPIKIKCKKMKDTVESLQTTREIKEILFSKIDEYCTMDQSNESATTAASYLNFALSLPYGKKKEMLPSTLSGGVVDRKKFLENVKAHLDANLFGMNKAKEQLLVALNNKLTNPSSSFSLGFKGPPGVGKTKVAAVFAEAIGFPIEKITLGGLQDATLLKGSQKNWVGSSSSMILQIMARMKISNGIILFDEIDKLNTDKGIEVQNALLHITDYSSNSEFTDAFVSDFSHDISNLIFFYSLNDEHSVNPILRDRLTIIDIEPYTHEELTNIGLNYTLKKEQKALNLTNEDFEITYDNMKFIVNKLYANVKKSGVRKLEQAIKYICSCINFMKHSEIKLDFVPSSTECNTINKKLEHFLTKGGFLKNQDEAHLSIYI